MLRGLAILLAFYFLLNPASLY